MFVELFHWSREIRFLPWSSIDFLLNVADMCIGNVIEVCHFWYVLPYKLVRVFDGSFLP